MIVRRTLAAALIATAASSAIATLAAETTPVAPDPVATRQAGFKQMGAAMKALNEQLKSDAPAKEPMLAAARTVAATAHQQGALFPAGSGPAPGVKTDALPNIWTDGATFDAAMATLVTEADTLVVVAGGDDVEKLRAQTKATGAACGSCHRQFRAES